MTGAELINWCVDHGCEVAPTSNTSSGLVVLVSKRSNSTAFVSAPFDEEITEFIIDTVCSRLGIERPATY